MIKKIIIILLIAFSVNAYAYGNPDFNIEADYIFYYKGMTAGIMKLKIDDKDHLEYETLIELSQIFKAYQEFKKYKKELQKSLSELESDLVRKSKTTDPYSYILGLGAELGLFGLIGFTLSFYYLFKHSNRKS